ncbi:aminodeoxychorismate lyase [Halobaculum sp. WSA2]|uniref:Aminodeoxychorismate lyase n=1 Tax=Halobaculum saliterrae TaxID=2073113 RepID=A0A6B0T0K6_9EURY|nr:aminotransferase class IV [Halobaculum saliterrae]MXR41770.1 aminodeoxychorismate lyase [Halobaculum saliterrae]
MSDDRDRTAGDDGDRTAGDDPTATDADGDDLVHHVDGELVPASEASVSVTDRGFQYGDAAFETVRAYGGTLWRWDAHVERLFGSLDALGMPADELGLSALDLEARVRDTLRANGLADAYVRLSVTRGETPAFAPPAAEETDPTVVVLAKPLPRGGSTDAGGESVWEGPATLQTVKTRRVSDRAIPSDAKTHNYLNNVLARVETRVTGADEAVVLDDDGHVAECATANLFFVADDAIRTPSLDGPVLPGVTRAEVLDIAREEGFPVEEGTCTPDDVRNADEAFIASSIRELRPVGTYDGVEVGGGPVTTLLSRLYDERVEAECYADDPGGAGDTGTDPRDGTDRNDGNDGDDDASSDGDVRE